MHDIRNRILSILLVAIMLLSTVSVGSFAAVLCPSAKAAVKTYNVGDTITFGTYSGQPIEWVCIAIDNNGPLMLAKNILCQKEYDAAGESSQYHNDGWGYIRKTYGSNCWADSNIRQWLNSSGNVAWTHCPPSYKNEQGFLSSFTEDELKQIKSVTQAVYVNSWEQTRGYVDGGTRESEDKNTIKEIEQTDYSPFWYQNVTDKIFLLGENQLVLGYKNLPDVVSINTPYLARIAKNNGASYENITTVESNGKLYGIKAYQKGNIRPAFYLDLDAINAENQDPGATQFTKSIVDKSEQDVHFEVKTVDANSHCTAKDGILYDANGTEIDEITFSVSTVNKGNKTIKNNQCTLEIGLRQNEVNSTYIFKYDKIDIEERKTEIIHVPADDIINNMHDVDMQIILSYITVYVSFNENEEYSISLYPESSVVNISYDFHRALFVQNYNPKIDKYSFENLFEVIDKKYYQAAYGLLKGEEVFNKWGGTTKSGHCFGMATTTKAFIENWPSTNIFGAETISGLSPDYFQNELLLTLSQYIKYAQISQWEYQAVQDRLSKQGINTVVEAVKNSLNSNSPVVILLDIYDEENDKLTKSHTVLAVGMENDDILINDSNNPNKICRITVDGSNWHYKGEFNWSSEENGRISYCNPVDVYSALLHDNYHEYSMNISLVLLGENTVPSEKYELTGLLPPAVQSDEDTEKTGNYELYWMKEGTEIEAKNCGTTEEEVKVINDKNKVSAIVFPNAQVKLNADENKPYAEISGSTNDAVCLTFSYVENDKIVDIQILGKANSEKVTATKENDNIKVTGLNSLTVTYSVEDEKTSQSTAEIIDGRLVNISIDRHNETVKTDFVEPETPDESAGTETPEGSNLCKYCHQDHGSSIWGRIVAFFHSILYFFAHLFGKM